MFCLLSFIFITMVAMQLVNGYINTVIGIIYIVYGFIMLYYTSKPYWTENIEENKKKRTNSNHQHRN